VSELLLGIDCGSTVTKAALFHLDGRELASSSSITETTALANSGVERSTGGIWTSVVRAVRDLVSDSGISPASIAAIGCCGHGNGLYALDGQGQALPTAFQSLDSRAQAIVIEWNEQGLGESLREVAWQQAWPGQPLPLLEWLRRHDRDTYDTIVTVFLCKDFVNHRMTGRAVSDFSDMSAAGLLANADRAYNHALFGSLGLADLDGKLPELVASTDVIGGLSAAAADELGLVLGTPVAGGLFDVAASAIGSGGAADGHLSLVAGTWSIASAVTRQPLIDDSLLMTTAFADAEHWMAISASATSAANLNWFTSEVFVDDRIWTGEASVFDRCCQAAESARLQLSGPLYHPYLYGSPLNPRARAGFYGIAGSHTRADLARAVLEGVAFGLRSHVAELVTAGATATQVRLTGGGVRNRFWSQMFADVLDMPIEIPDVEETGARGAALVAGVAVGAYPGLPEAMETATGVARRHHPDARNAPIHTQRFAIYRSLVEAMGPAWLALSRVPDDSTGGQLGQADADA
jgi:L-xylulokinase